MSKILKNKKIIISAGASGIGWATAKICLARGAYIYLCDNDEKSLRKLNKHPLKNKRLFDYSCDASNESQVSDFFKKIKNKTKKIDSLINNVGVSGPTGSIEQLNSKDWENTLHVDVNSHFYFTKRAIPLIKKSKNGSIINISSTAGILGFPLRSPYAASKWAIIGITKTLAMELGKFNIRVNAVAPGWMDTPGEDEIQKKFHNARDSWLEESEKKQPFGQLIKTYEISPLIVYLLSPSSGVITGSIIDYDQNIVGSVPE